MAPTTVSGMVRRLTDRGHLSHTPNPRDARSRLLTLTEDGEHVTVNGGDRLAALMPNLLDALGPHAPTAHIGLRRLDRALRSLIGAAERPDAPLAGEDRDAQAPDVHTVPPEMPLTDAQQREVQQYIRWIRTRDATPSQPRDRPPPTRGT
jgi:hypothetical protein